MANGRRDFDYKPPSYDDVVDRAERKGSMFDTMFRDVKVWTPKQGANLIRILPPTWENNRGHYGLYIKLHYNVGPEDRRYLCLRDPNSPHKRCPVCEALYDLGANASREEKFALRSADAVCYYIIERDNEKEGVQVWLTSPTNDSEIAAQSVNRRNKSVLPVADPIDGYDVEFSRSGTGKTKTRYRGFQVMRDSSPLSDSDKQMDEWLDAVFDHPLPTVLNFYSPEHVEEVFYGRAKEAAVESSRSRTVRDDDDNGDRGGGRNRSRDSDVAEDKDDAGADQRPSRSRGRDADDGEDDRRPTRSRGHDEEEKLARPRADDAADRSERPSRSRLSKELDDEIPSDAGRRGSANGRDDDAHPTAPERGERPSRRTRDDDDDARPRRAERPARDDDDDNDDRRPSRSRGAADEHEARRERVRERLNKT